MALIHNARKIASYYKPKLSQVQINKALLVMINRELSLVGARLAVEMGADVNYKPDSGTMDPLESALDEEEYEIADFLFAKGARLPARGIIRPCSRGKPLERGIIHSLVNSHYMPVGEIYNNLSWLLEKGYDPDDAGDTKRTAVHDAYRPRIIRLLCQYGADPNRIDEIGWSPLLRLNGNTPKRALKTAIILTNFGADIHYQHPINKQNILHLAATRGLTDVVAHFLIKGVNKQIKNACGLLPVELVKNNPDLTTMLLSDELPHMPKDALKIEEKLQKLKQKIA